MNQPTPSEAPDQPRTIKPGGGRAWIYPTPTQGRFTNLRVVSSVLLLVILYATPWLRIGGAPFLKLSFLEPAFFIFGRAILIYEFHHFVLLALLLVLTLLMASALFGRVWCGYACPQTIFIEQLFGRIEVLFEGSAAKRALAAGKPLTASRLAKKAAKQLVFVAVSFSFAFSLVALFTGTELLLTASSRGAWTAVTLLTALAWFDGAYWREQFCHIVCPYGRFQAVMQDQATRTIGYDQQRGEPRRRGKDRSGAGACIDCGLCVRVCPSGIDIRQGAHQLECIGCAKCVDACDGVMAQIGSPRGLVRYDAVVMFQNDPPPKPPGFLRPRLLIYAAMWLSLAGVGIYQFIQRTAFHTQILSASGSAPYFLDGDRVKNLLSLKIGNQWTGPDSYALTVSAADAAAGDPSFRIESPATFGPLAPGSESVYPILLSAPRHAAGLKLILTVTAVHSGEVKTFARQIVGPAE